MGAVHSFVAEVFGKFVHSVKSAHNQTLEVELVGNTQVERNIQGVVVRHKGPRGGSAWNRLQNRGLNLEVAGLVKDAAHRAKNLGAGHEHVAHTLVHHEVHVALAVAQFGVAERVVHGSVRVLFHGRKRAQRLAQHLEARGVHTDFSGLRGEHVAVECHKVSEVQMLLEHVVVKCLVVAGADLVAVDVHLNAARAVLDAGKRSLAHDAFGHESAGHTDFGVGLGVGGVAA